MLFKSDASPLQLHFDLLSFLSIVFYKKLKLNKCRLWWNLLWLTECEEITSNFCSRNQFFWNIRSGVNSRSFSSAYLWRLITILRKVYATWLGDCKAWKFPNNVMAKAIDLTCEKQVQTQKLIWGLFNPHDASMSNNQET